VKLVLDLESKPAATFQKMLPHVGSNER
jgi:hypothetical protein